MLSKLTLAFIAFVSYTYAQTCSQEPCEYQGNLDECRFDVCYEGDTLVSCEMVRPGLSEDCIFWYEYYQVDTCGMYYEDPIDCSDERELPACIWQDAYDDCDDIAYCYVTWVESNRQQNDTCTNFQNWHEEWLICRPVETSHDCEDESGLPECSRTYYHEPCTDIEICWVEYTDLEGESSNITCTQYFDWLENIENGDWCRYLDFNESCASFDWTSD